MAIGGTPALRDRDQGNSVDSQVASYSDSDLSTASGNASTITSRCVSRSVRACRSVLRDRRSVVDSQGLGRERAGRGVGHNGHALAQSSQLP